MDLKQTIMSLADAYGVSGDESEAAELALSYLKEYTDDCCIKNGSVFGNFGERKEGKPHILLDAHIDRIGFVVTHITDDGFLKISGVGGIDRRLLLAQQVVIVGKENVKGVICTIPPHLDKGEDKKVPKMKDICVDVGMTKEQAEKVISLGDKMLFMQKAAELQGDRIAGAALDDRCGVACLLRAVEMLKDEKPNCSYSVMFSSQEEVGGRGAKVGTYGIDPDIAIAVDVSFAKTADDTDNEKCGELGGGCMIGFAPTLDRGLSVRMTEIAEKNDLPYRREVMSSSTGTNADDISVNKSGVKAVTLSIPLKYMHTPVEVISLSDVENTAKIIAEYIREVK